MRSGPFSRRVPFLQPFLPCDSDAQVFNNDPMIEVVVTDEAQGDCM